MSNNLKVLYREDEIRNRVKELASEITKDFIGQELIIVSVLKGSFMFLADLVRELDLDVKIDFVRLSSYEDRMESKGCVVLKKDIEMDIAGKNVLVVDDIADTGITLKFLKENLEKRGPKSVKICVFLDKYKKREVDLEPDYRGFLIEEGFVVGYGLDFAEKYRNLKEVYVIA